MTTDSTRTVHPRNEPIDDDPPAQILPLRQRTPHVIACGQRHILVPKSSLMYPAWLVQLPGGKCCWRSKRDFWRLGRVAPRPIIFPKQAFHKLLQASPWKRPDYPEFCQEDMISAEGLVTDNNWVVQCTKNLLRMDQFLGQVHRQFCQAEESTPRSDGMSSSYPKLHTAWIEFCRPQDTDNLIDDLAVSVNPNTLPQNSSTLRGNELSQYFCSSDSADRLIRLFLEQIDYFIVDAEGNPRLVTIIEPSCGDGRLLQSLCDHFELRAPLSFQMPVLLGLDIDANVIDQAFHSRQHLPVSWKTLDFLKTRRSDLLESHPSSTVLILGGPPYSAGAGSIANYSGVEDADVSTIMERNLPFRFVQHAIREIQAEVICFLMPERYRHSTPLQRLLEDTGYGCSTQDCDSLFHFRGQAEAIKQPSIIQCFWRKAAGFTISLRHSRSMLLYSKK